MGLKNSVHNIKNKDQVQITTFNLCSIKLVTKMRITTCHRHQSKLISLNHHIVRKRQVIKDWKCLSRKLEKDLFNSENVKKVRHNLSKDEKAALKDIRYWDKNVARVQDKGSRFVVLENEDYIKKV